MQAPFKVIRQRHVVQLPGESTETTIEMAVDVRQLLYLLGPKAKLATTGRARLGGKSVEVKVLTAEDAAIPLR